MATASLSGVALRPSASGRQDLERGVTPIHAAALQARLNEAASLLEQVHQAARSTSAGSRSSASADAVTSRVDTPGSTGGSTGESTGGGSRSSFRGSSGGSTRGRTDVSAAVAAAADSEMQGQTDAHTEASSSSAVEWNRGSFLLANQQDADALTALVQANIEEGRRCSIHQWTCLHRDVHLHEGLAG
jgi:hypothetical protein